MDTQEFSDFDTMEEGSEAGYATVARSPLPDPDFLPSAVDVQQEWPNV